MSLSHIFIFIALVSYAASAALFFGSVNGKKSSQAFVKYAMRPFLVATLGMSLSLFDVFKSGLYNELSSLVLITIISWLTVIGYYIFRMKLMGVFVAPLSIVILMFQLFTDHTSPSLSTEPLNFLGMAHIVLAIIGEAFAVCAWVIALLYLRQQNILKKKKIGLIPKGSPSLDKLDRYQFFSLWFGFTFLTLGLITGAIYTAVHGIADSSIYSKVFWAIAVWVWYLVILIARNVIGLSSRKISIMSLVGFLMISLSILGFISLGDSI